MTTASTRPPRPALSITDEPPNRLRNPAYLRNNATAYLDGVADVLAGAKLAIRQVLAPMPGERLLDVGCGTGVDVLALADQVGPTGRALGIDTSDELIAKARDRADGNGVVRFEVGDAADLPLHHSTFDGARAERVLQHVAEPAAAVAELLRVTVPGGRVVLAEPDHEMWVVNTSDVVVTRSLLTWWVGHIRNPAIGRRLPELLIAAGARDVGVEVLPLVLPGLAAGDAVIGLAKLATAAQQARVVSPEQLSAWQADLREREARNSLMTLGAIVVASGVKPGSEGR
jgi:SAM-dependent methyltransferase